MLTTEPSDSGQQATLTASGILRFFPAGFLAFWLCGWAVGEWFGLRMFASLLRTLLGWSFLAQWFPPLGGKAPDGPVLWFFVAFLTFWLVFWTIGGIGAFQQMLLMLCGRDVIRWGTDALEVEHRALWFVNRTRIPAREITGIRVTKVSIVADTRRRAVRLTALGSVDDRRQLGAMLEDWRATAAPPEPLREDESPVPMFVTFRDETGAIALQAPPGARRTSGVLMAVLALALFAAALSLHTQKSGAGLVVGMLVLGLGGAGCLYGALWLLAARESWHMGPTRLERRREFFGRTWSTEFVPLELQLTATNDSDGDTRWDLVAIGAGGRHSITSAIDDPNVPQTLGTWLSERTGARFVRRGFEHDIKRAAG